MKERLLITTLLLVAVLGTSVCRKSAPEPDVSQLEELPKDIADNLKRVPDSDVLVSIAPIAAPSPLPTPVKPGGPVFVRACSERQSFVVQVIYPVTVCTRPDLIASTFMAPAPPRNTGPTATTIVKSYKLSAFEGKPFPTPFGCRTHNGPWITTITRSIECNNATSCQMVIQGVPSCPACPAFLWGGENCQNNPPPPVKLVGTAFPQGGPTLSPCSAKTTCGDAPPPTPGPIF